MKWAEASDRIQRELLYWNRKLSGSLEAEKTIVLLDRSLFSRFILFRQIDPTVSLNSLMRTSEGRKILLPNILFIFSVEMEQLFSRISTTDPKGAFRRRNIQESMPIFEKIIHELPLAIKERTKIIMCAEDNPHQIATRVYSCISSLIPLS